MAAHGPIPCDSGQTNDWVTWLACPTIVNGRNSIHLCESFVLFVSFVSFVVVLVSFLI